MISGAYQADVAVLVVNSTTGQRFILVTGRRSRSRGDQLNMVVFFWYLVKHDSIVDYCTVAYTNVTFFKMLVKHGNVYLVRL